MLRFALLAICMMGSVISLNLEDAEEGPCHGVQFHPVRDIDYSFLSGRTYMPAASRYQLYRIAANHPRFRKMRDFELQNNMCLVFNTYNVSETLWQGQANGFGGRLLGRYTFTPKQNQSAVIDFTHQFPGSFGGSGTGKPYNGTGTETVTLTDHKTFAFLGACWVDSDQRDQRSWEVVANTQELSSSAKWLIKQHAAALGFNRENVIFLNYKTCGNYVDDYGDDEDGSITTSVP